MNSDEFNDFLEMLNKLAFEDNNKQVFDDFATIIKCYKRSGKEINAMFETLVNNKKPTKNLDAILDKYRNM